VSLSYKTLLQQPFVFFMAANPIPDYRVPFKQAENPIIFGHRCRVAGSDVFWGHWR